MRLYKKTDDYNFMFTDRNQIFMRNLYAIGAWVSMLYLHQIYAIFIYYFVKIKFQFPFEPLSWGLQLSMILLQVAP